MTKKPKNKGETPIKKITALLLLLALVLTLCACGEDAAAGDDQVITRSTEDTSAADAVQDTTTGDTLSVTPHFAYEGVELVPSAVFDPAALPEADSLYEAPSCAIEGTDNLYNYGSFELTAFDDGSTETIYSIYLIDPAVATTEGLKVSDPASRVTELYGEDYVLDGTAYVYTYEAAVLTVVIQNDTVLSIEYRQLLAGE